MARSIPKSGWPRALTLGAMILGFFLGVVGATLDVVEKDLGWTGYMSVPLLSLKLYLPRPEVVTGDHHLIYRIAAVVSGTAGILGAFGIWLATAGTTLASLWTQYGRWGHIVVAGDTAFAAGLAQALRKAGHSAVLVRSKPSPGTKTETDPEAPVRCGFGPAGLAAKAGLHRARGIVVDGGGDAETLSIARPILHEIDSRSGKRPGHLALHVSDTFISDQFFEIARRLKLGHQTKTSVFDENRLIARHSLAADPLFVRAKARNQRRVHALIVGFGNLGEKLLDQVMLTSVAGDLGMPKVTILDRQADACQRAFAARRSRVMNHLDVSFHTLDVGADPCEGPTAAKCVEALRKAEVENPFTAIYLALPTHADTMRAALILDRQRETNGTFAAPISYRCRLSSEEQDLLEEPTPPADADRGFIRMWVPERLLVDTVLGSPVLDRLAVLLHDAYRASGRASEETDVPWHQLPETFRRSNVRAADHLAAKLWTLGIRRETNPDDVWEPTKADIASIQSVIDEGMGGNTLNRLARIEHDRWMIDRFLDGWMPGPKRQKERRVHDLLVPWSEIVKRPDEADKDRQQVLTILQDVVRLETR